jgi:DNA-directed RNA polymerase subunit RPC12/RpoP
MKLDLSEVGIARMIRDWNRTHPEIVTNDLVGMNVDIKILNERELMNKKNKLLRFECYNCGFKNESIDFDYEECPKCGGHIMRNVLEISNLNKSGRDINMTDYTGWTYEELKAREKVLEIQFNNKVHEMQMKYGLDKTAQLLKGLVNSDGVVVERFGSKLAIRGDYANAPKGKFKRLSR